MWKVCYAIYMLILGPEAENQPWYFGMLWGGGGCSEWLEECYVGFLKRVGSVASG